MASFTGTLPHGSISICMAENQPFTPGKDWLWYSRAVYGEREIAAVLESLNSDWLVPGEYSRRFEEAVAKKFGQGFGLFVNSGSSANLIGTQVLNLPRGGEVVTPACTFATTINPLLQLGLVPVFVDVEFDTFNSNLDAVEAAITEKTVALCIPHIMGNLNDVRRLRQIADAHKLAFIEDSCDTIGGSINGEPTGKYADVTTTSFYASHIMTAAGGGGMVMYKTKEQQEAGKILRDWGRALPEHFDEDINKRLSFTLDGVPYDGKFVFTNFGYNLKPIDLMAAFGLVQLERLEEFYAIRKANFAVLKEFFSAYPQHFLPARELPGADVRWLSYPIIIREDSPIQRNDMMRFLEGNKIQTRVLFSGNILHHPAYANIPHRVYGSLDNSEKILRQCLLVGCHHGLRREHLDYLKSTLAQFLKQY